MYIRSRRSARLYPPALRMRVVNAMAYDKKVKAGKVRFVLPDRIGHVVVRDDAPLDLVRRAVEALRG